MWVFGFALKEAEAKHSRCHFVSSVMYMYISGAEFEEHCPNISGDILDSVFYCLSETMYYDVVNHFPHLHDTKINVNISKMKKGYSKNNGKHHLS